MSAYQPSTPSAPGVGAWGRVAQVALEALPAIYGAMTRPMPGMPGGAGIGATGMYGGFGMPVAAPAGMRVSRRGGRINASASSYCRRNPSWCTQVGGVGAVAQMVAGGQLPTIRRGRGRGISAREFRGFRKVHRVLSAFCAPRMRIRSRKRS